MIHSWRTAGVWAEISDDFNPHPEYYGRLLYNNQFRWLAIKIHDGLNETPLVSHDWISWCQSQGISVGGWGMLQTDPKDEAKLVKALCKRYGMQFYIADVEAAHKSDTGGDPHRSEIFADTFESIMTYPMPRAFSTEGAASGENCLTDVMNFPAWIKRKWRYIPQVYPNQFGDVFSLINCIHHAIRCGVPLSIVKPVIGNYGGWHAEQYKDALHTIFMQYPQLRGFSVFIAQQTREEDFNAYGKYIRNWWLADT